MATYFHRVTIFFELFLQSFSSFFYLLNIKLSKLFEKSIFAKRVQKERASGRNDEHCSEEEERGFYQPWVLMVLASLFF